jgi:hypothetical protein
MLDGLGAKESMMTQKLFGAKSPAVLLLGRPRPNSPWAAASAGAVKERITELPSSRAVAGGKLSGTGVTKEFSRAPITPSFAQFHSAAVASFLVHSTGWDGPANAMYLRSMTSGNFPRAFGFR